ncbi:MAG: putative quinol monooxygenase [Saccharofermentanales bacterium]
MHVRIATFFVKPERVADFIAATLENQRNSRQEPGVITFDFQQGADDPNRFVLYEIFKTDADFEYHLTTNHFKAWIAVVPDMFSKPREVALYRSVGE